MFLSRLQSRLPFRLPQRLPSLRWIVVAALGAGVVALLLNAWHYAPFIADDAFISLRYAERLLDGKGLTWTDGPPVEGYSNLLWTLLCAGLGALGLDLVWAARILGFLGMSAVLGAILWAVRPGRGFDVGAALVGMLGFALAGPTGAWLIGGLEQPLVAGLLAWGLALCLPWLEQEQVRVRQLLGPGLVLALLTVSRADAAVLVAGACLGVVLVRGVRDRRAWRLGLMLGALPLAAFLGQLWFRLAYYDAWVPNTALVKVAFTLERLGTGWEYTYTAALACAPLLALGATSVAASAWQRGPGWRQAGFLWTAALVWAGYVLFIGGDIFPAYRHWIPVLVPVCLSAALGVRTLAGLWPRLRWVGVLVAMLAVVLFAVRQPRDPENHRAVTERWEYNGEVIGRLLHRAFGDPAQPEREPLLAAMAVGAICYHAKLPSLDMLGLNDRYIAEHRPEDFGTGLIGHELGDGAYILSRAPDLIVFCGPTGREKPCSRGGQEMVKDPSFHRDHQLVYFRGTEPFEVVGRIWVRRAGKAGIEARDDGLTVPGYLLHAGQDARAELDEHGRIGLRIPPGKTGHVDLELATGDWRLRVDTDATTISTTVTTRGNTRATHRGDAEASFSLADADSGEVPVRIQVRSSEPVHVRSLVLERAP